jgi:tRNA-splicing ligase RtcB
MNRPTVFGQHDDKTIVQLRDVASRAAKAALMADGHVGYVMPIGGVAAYRNKVSVVGVGFDIACGNAAIRTDLKLTDVAPAGPERDHALGRIADRIAGTVSFGVGRKNRADDAPTDHPLFHDAAWDAVPAAQRQPLRDKARGQLGTVGSGNHYVDVFADDTDTLWVGVHFGSRGFGFGVAHGFLALGQGQRWDERVPEREVLLDLATTLGEGYWELMNLAGRYAYAGREWVARKVVELLGGRELELPAQRGFVGGSMGDDAVILEGAQAADAATTRLQRDALFSTVHGAGRVMSRTQAAGKRTRRGKVLAPGRVTADMMREWVRGKGVILRGGGLDESPHVYRRLPDVLAAQGATVKVLRTLRPLIVVMAGAEEFDPYTD